MEFECLSYYLEISQLVLVLKLESEQVSAQFVIQWHADFTIKSNRGLRWNVADSHSLLDLNIGLVAHMHYLRAKRPVYLSVVHDFYSLHDGVAWLQNDVVAIPDTQKFKTVKNGFPDRLQLHVCT